MLAVRAAVGQAVQLRADANCAWTLEQAIAFGQVRTRKQAQMSWSRLLTIPAHFWDCTAPLLVRANMSIDEQALQVCLLSKSTGR